MKVKKGNRKVFASQFSHVPLDDQTIEVYPLYEKSFSNENEKPTKNHEICARKLSTLKGRKYDMKMNSFHNFPWKCSTVIMCAALAEIICTSPELRQRATRRGRYLMQLGLVDGSPHFTGKNLILNVLTVKCWAGRKSDFKIINATEKLFVCSSHESFEHTF